MTDDYFNAQPIHSRNKVIQTHYGKVYIWSIMNYSALIAAGIKKRELEKKSVALKLEELGLSYTINYKNSGQPYFEHNSELQISISHSKDVMSIYLANKEIGVDIEHHRTRLYEGRNYFVNKKEELFELSQATLQLIWGGKESLFKQFGGAIDDLKNDVTLIEIDEVREKIIFSFQDSHHAFSFKRFDDLWLVYSD